MMRVMAAALWVAVSQSSLLFGADAGTDATAALRTNFKIVP